MKTVPALEIARDRVNKLTSLTLNVKPEAAFIAFAIFTLAVVVHDAIVSSANMLAEVYLNHAKD